MCGKTDYNKPLILQRADPYVYKHTDGKYYFTASVPEYDRIVLRCADSIHGLADAEEKVIWRKHESGPMGNHIWAPELHYLGGAWYIYFAAGSAEDKWKIRPYVLECTGKDPMTDEFHELGMMQCASTDPFSFRAFSLDATVFEHQGEHYYVWAEKVGVGSQISNLYIARMATPNRLDTVQVLLTTPDYDWERIGFWVDEGPGVIKHNGKIFLTFSASETTKNYCIGLMYADGDADLLDPQSWTKLRKPVLVSSKEHGLFGPGHNSFTKSEDGKKDIMVYHARTYEDIEGNSLYDPNRHTMCMEIKWDEETGMPVFSFENNCQ